MHQAMQRERDRNSYKPTGWYDQTDKKESGCQRHAEHKERSQNSIQRDERPAKEKHAAYLVLESAR